MARMLGISRGAEGDWRRAVDPGAVPALAADSAREIKAILVVQVDTARRDHRYSAIRQHRPATIPPF